MAFCPECGKPITAEAVNCQACGLELPVEAKRAASRRFNETVMMASPVSVQPGAPANANAASKAQASQPEAAAPATASTLKQAGAPAAAVVQPRGGLKAAKATMLGTGLSPLIARAVAVPRSEVAFSAAQAEPLQSQSAPVEIAETLRPPEAEAANANSDVPRLREDLSSRSRVAPDALRLRTDHDDQPALVPAEVLETGALPRHVEAAAVLDKEYARHSRELQLLAAETVDTSRGTGRPARLRLADDEEGPLQIPKTERVWVYWGACGVVVVSVMLLAYGFGLFW
jgi:hypothetical protein